MSLVSLFAKNNWNNQVKEDEIGRACSTNGKEEECMQNIGGKTRREEIAMKLKTYVGE
jgi:hypothetical protein